MTLRNIAEWEVLSVIVEVFDPIEITSCDYHYDDDTWTVRLVTDGWFNNVIRNSERKDLITLSKDRIKAAPEFHLTEADQQVWRNLLIKKGFTHYG